MMASSRTEFVHLSMVGIVPSGSFVNTDENCFSKIFAFSLSLNLRELLFFTSSSRGQHYILFLIFFECATRKLFGYFWNFVR